MLQDGSCSPRMVSYLILRGKDREMAARIRTYETGPHANFEGGTLRGRRQLLSAGLDSNERPVAIAIFDRLETVYFIEPVVDRLYELKIRKTSDFKRFEEFFG